MESAFPATVQECLHILQTHYTTILASNLIGMVVHGSIAMDCFNPESSDIDVLVVVQHALSLPTKTRLGQLHVALQKSVESGIELSVVIHTPLFGYPTPYEFHYSDDHLAAFASNTVDLSVAHTDYDLAAHFVIARKFGITLAGQAAQDILPEVPVQYYLDSIARDAEWGFNNVMAGSGEGTCPVPKYATLNFCRVLAFISDGLITSKKTGAVWALSHLPGKYAVVIREALNEYQQSGSSQPVDCQTLLEFAVFSYNIIKNHRPQA